jgi:hypothetical protein
LRIFLGGHRRLSTPDDPGREWAELPTDRDERRRPRAVTAVLAMRTIDIAAVDAVADQT